MRSIDERIVDMQFNNKQFENGIQESLSSLENLKKGLNLDGAAKGFDSLSKAAKDVDMSPISQGLEAVKVSFSALSVIGATVLSELTKSAMQLGSSLLSSLVEPIVQGGKQRALNIEQAKFQFKGLGMDVEAAMNSAREAVLGTAYGLDEAAKVASQLGASGMQAGDEMTTSLRAIAGVAAMTSSSYSDIGNIFTTVAGNGRLMTHQLNQLSSRGMNAAAILAQSMGTTEAAVREMVTKGKISFQMFSDAMSEAFGEHATSANQTYTGSLSNMRAALARIGADVWTLALEHFRDVFNSLTPVLNNVHKSLEPVISAINSLIASLSGFAIKKLDGLDLSYLSPILLSIVDTIKNIASGIGSVLTPIKEAFQEIFPPTTAEKLANLTEAFKLFTEKLKIGDETAANLKSTFKGLFSIFDFASQVIGVLFRTFSEVTGILLPGADGILSFTGNIGEFIAGLNDAIRTGDVFNKAFDTIKGAITTVAGAIREDVKGMMQTPAFQVLQEIITNAADKIKDAFDKIKEVFGGFGGIDLSGAKSLVEGAETHFRPFTALGTVLSAAFEVVQKILQKVAPIFSKLATVVGDAFKKLGDAVGGAFKDGGFQGVLDLINGGIFAGILLGIKRFMDTLSDLTSNADGILDGITGILDGVKGSLEAYQSSLKAKTLMTIAGAIALLAASLVVLSMIDSEKLTVSLGAITVLFIELAGAMIVMQKVMGSGGMIKVSTTMIAMATAILILSAALKSLAELDWEGVAKGAAGIGVLMVELQLFMKNVKGEKLMSTSIAMIAIGAAMNILASAVKQLGEMDVETLLKGLAGKQREYSIFGNKVSESRFCEVRSQLYGALNGWKPVFNNIKTLWLQHGSDWKETPIANAKELSIKEAWSDMPLEAIRYITGLPEFDRDMFLKITGIDK